MDLELFFKKNRVPFTKWTLEHKGALHSIDSDFIIQKLLEIKGNKREFVCSRLNAVISGRACLLECLEYLAKSFVEDTY